MHSIRSRRSAISDHRSKRRANCQFAGPPRHVEAPDILPGLSEQCGYGKELVACRCYGSAHQCVLEIGGREFLEKLCVF